MAKLEELCPKCSCYMPCGGLKEHIESCKSTLVDDGVEIISNMIDKMVYEGVTNG